MATTTTSAHHVKTISARKQAYLDYMASPEWQARREQILRRDAYRCRLCSRTTGTLDVHHSTYKRLGRELDNDLITLCRRCHRRFHERLKHGKTSDEMLGAPNGPNGAWSKKQIACMKRIVADSSRRKPQNMPRVPFSEKPYEQKYAADLQSSPWIGKDLIHPK